MEDDDKDGRGDPVMDAMFGAGEPAPPPGRDVTGLSPDHFDGVETPAGPRMEAGDDGALPPRVPGEQEQLAETIARLVSTGTQEMFRKDLDLRVQADRDLADRIGSEMWRIREEKANEALLKVLAGPAEAVKRLGRAAGLLSSREEDPGGSAAEVRRLLEGAVRAVEAVVPEEGADWSPLDRTAGREGSAMGESARVAKGWMEAALIQLAEMEGGPDRVRAARTGAQGRMGAALVELAAVFGAPAEAGAEPALAPGVERAGPGEDEVLGYLRRQHGELFRWLEKNDSWRRRFIWVMLPMSVLAAALGLAVGLIYADSAPIVQLLSG